MTDRQDLPQRLIIATGNSGKLREFKDLLVPLEIPLHSLGEFDSISEPDETGATFAENAAIKARSYALQTGEWVIADDSGLEIDHLLGAPGVHSARYGGRASGYDEKMRLVLQQLSDVGISDRGARFVSVIALAKPTGEVAIMVDGICSGAIGKEPRGSGGFGYDPIFIPDGFDRTFGEMSDDEKRFLSHRGKASRAFIRQMLDFTGL
jgi:XTP/dITP diphosphohydrolase